MAFTPAAGDWTMRKVPSKASTAYTAGGFVYSDNTDNIPVTTTTQNNVIGILQESKSSALTTTTDLHVLCPVSSTSTFYADVVSTESITKADEGAAFDFSSTGLTISTASTYDVVELVKFISATKGEFRLNITYGIEN